MNDSIQLNLTKKQYSLIIESLLYSSNALVDSKWYLEEMLEMANLAIDMRMNKPEILLRDVFLISDMYKDIDLKIFTEHDKKTSKKIIDFFPEIVENVYP
jgi:hypothetical protein